MLVNIPMLFIFAGLAAYTILSGADFGVGFWILFSDSKHTELRDYARHAMGPVWEANHVWLIFVIVVCWTAYPVAFASIASTLCVPLSIAAVGIILRGTAYALRGQLESLNHQVHIDRVFAVSSMLTPFAMGAAVGSIASGRVPVGNAAGDLFTSWINPTSMLIGILAVAVSSYLSAVYLAADASRMGHSKLEHEFRNRAFIAGRLTGPIAFIGLIVLRYDARPIWDGLTSGRGILTIAVSTVAGMLTLLLNRRRHFATARVTAAIAVVSIMAGWAIAQHPHFLPGLTVRQAAAPRDTLVALIISVAAGAVILVPALLLLFGLFLGGHLDAGHDGAAQAPVAGPVGMQHGTWIKATPVAAGLAVGAGVTVLADGWMQAIGIVCLCTSAVAAFILAAGLEDESSSAGTLK